MLSFEENEKSPTRLSHGSENHTESKRSGDGALIRICATIYVERHGQKGIIIGKGGLVLKKIGTDARLELESLLGVKVFLQLFVKVQHNWRDNAALVRQLDWHRQLERLAEE